MFTVLFLALALTQEAKMAGDVCLDTYIVDPLRDDGRRMIRREAGFSWEDPETMRTRQKTIAIGGNFAGLPNDGDFGTWYPAHRIWGVEAVPLCRGHI